MTRRVWTLRLRIVLVWIVWIIGVSGMWPGVFRVIPGHGRKRRERVQGQRTKGVEREVKMRVDKGESWREVGKARGRLSSGGWRLRLTPLP